MEQSRAGGVMEQSRASGVMEPSRTSGVLEKLRAGGVIGRSRGQGAVQGWPGLAALLALALLLPTVSAVAAAAASVVAGANSPPVLNIASEPLAAGCRLAGASGGLDRGTPVVPAGGSDAFQASFDPSDWSGHLERYAVLASDGRLAAAPPSWDAGAILTGSAIQPPRPAPSARRIYTAIVQTDGRLQTVPFEWAQLSDVQRALLNLPSSAPHSKPDGLGEMRLAYLRGDRTLEGHPFRRRSSVLGDAVNSNPLYVSAPSPVAQAADQGNSYAAFSQRYQSRRNMLYLGANDGMLHAFDASDGIELFAYVPDALMSALSSLASPDYVHRAFVDGPAIAAEAWTGDRWRTVLVSAMGGGAQGIFALDVTNPDHFERALWEFTDQDDPMMGNVTTTPQIARFQLHAGVPEYRYFAVVASGLNNYANDGHRSAAGKGALFLLALDKPADVAWQLNVNYFRVITPISDPTLANALAAPVLVTDLDGIVRYAYAGDLQGNLWRLDFQGSAPWSDKTALFVARDANGRRQPISQQPKVAYALGGGYLILFGTGSLIEKADRSPTGFAPQSYYAILDTLARPADVVSGRKELTRRVLSGSLNDASLSLSGSEIEPGSKGWYVDFLDAAETGERSLNSGTLLGGVLYFNTLVPGRDSCAPAQARSYALDVLSGLGSPLATVTSNSGFVSAPFVGVLQTMYAAAPVALPVADSTTSRQIGSRVAVDKRFDIANFGTTDSGRVRGVGRASVTLRAGRLSWREVANWRELHAAAR